MHDAVAERALLGDLLALSQRFSEAEAIVTASDFYETAHGAVFTAMLELHRGGHSIEPESVRQQLGDDLKLVGGTKGLAELAMAGGGNWRKYAETVLAWATRRKVFAAVTDLRQALETDMDPADVIDLGKARLASIDTPRMDIPDDVTSFDDFLDRPAEEQPEWAIPGLLREGHRAMVVAPEGYGKSVLFRQFALLAAQGIHPLTFETMKPVRSLLVDLENPVEAISTTAEPLRIKTRGIKGTAYREHAAWLWHRPGGIDLRKRSDRAEFEAILEHTRPGLVCMGPLYKCYRVNGGENDEQAAGMVQNIFDDLRTRFSFALVLEHHAPKRQNGYRDLAPYGSSLWLRWPEFGIKLVPPDEDSTALKVERWRGDRLVAAWPEMLERGTTWPWVGVWPTGTMNRRPF